MHFNCDAQGQWPTCYHLHTNVPVELLLETGLDTEIVTIHSWIGIYLSRHHMTNENMQLSYAHEKYLSAKLCKKWCIGFYGSIYSVYRPNVYWCDKYIQASRPYNCRNIYSGHTIGKSMGTEKCPGDHRNKETTNGNRTYMFRSARDLLDRTQQEYSCFCDILYITVIQKYRKSYCQILYIEFIQYHFRNINSRATTDSCKKYDTKTYIYGKSCWHAVCRKM